MPSAVQILEGIEAIATTWWPLATAWHVATLVLLSLSIGRRLSSAALGYALSILPVSVSAMAFWSLNWFNGIVFAGLSLFMAWQSSRLPHTPPAVAVPANLTIGFAAVAFGWVYPHFLDHASLWTYMYAAPLGVIPCPSLSAVIGLSLMANLLDSPRWGLTTGVTGLVYGAIGVVGLGVGLDVWLIAFAAAILSVSIRRWRTANGSGNIPRHAGNATAAMSQPV